MLPDRERSPCRLEPWLQTSVQTEDSCVTRHSHLSLISFAALMNVREKNLLATPGRRGGKAVGKKAYHGGH